VPNPIWLESQVDRGESPSLGSESGNFVCILALNSGFSGEQIVLRSTRHFRMDEPEVSSSVGIGGSRLDGTVWGEKQGDDAVDMEGMISANMHLRGMAYWTGALVQWRGVISPLMIVYLHKSGRNVIWH